MWGFSNGTVLERVHIQICKQMQPKTISEVRSEEWKAGHHYEVLVQNITLREYEIH